MKIPFLTLLGFCLAPLLPAQGLADEIPTIKRTPGELAELLGPIALYPDALIALILPASTAPLDIVLAARHVAANGGPAEAGEQSWDASVEALSHYPDTLKWLDENLEWTTEIGDAFIEQPVEVMESIQELRARARALGNLVDTPQQRVVMDDTDIRIIPAQPDYIYEPRYDPEVIYVNRPVAGPLLFFSAGYGVGSWLNYDWDWRRHRLYRGDWHQGWDYQRDNDRRDREDDRRINKHLTNSQQWQPDRVRHHAQSRSIAGRTAGDRGSSGRTQSNEPGKSEPRDRRAGVARPKPMIGAPHQGGTGKRADQNEKGKAGTDPSTRPSRENKPEADSKDRRVAPKSDAPGMPGGGREGRESSDKSDRGKPGEDPGSVNRKAGTPPKRESDAKTQGAAPHREPAKEERRKQEETPKREEPTRRVVPKPEAEMKPEASKRTGAPRPEEEFARSHEPLRRNSSRREETVKPSEAKKGEEPRRQAARPQEPDKRVAPRREEPKSPGGAADERGRGGPKKRDEDKDKDKKKD